MAESTCGPIRDWTSEVNIWNVLNLIFLALTLGALIVQLMLIKYVERGAAVVLTAVVVFFAALTMITSIVVLTDGVEGNG
jgi:uncharacterized membrane protein YesL